MLLIKTDANGAALWTRRYGAASIDGANGLALAADGNYLVGATTRSYGGTITDQAAAVMWDDLFLVKVTPDGSTVWQKVKGVRPRALDATMGMARTADGGFVIAGEAGGNPLLVKFDRDGATAVLQKDDLTISLPSTAGAINFDNAIDMAGAGAGALLLPGQVGGELLDLSDRRFVRRLPGRLLHRRWQLPLRARRTGDAGGRGELHADLRPVRSRHRRRQVPDPRQRAADADLGQRRAREQRLPGHPAGDEHRARGRRARFDAAAESDLRAAVSGCSVGWQPAIATKS